MSRGKSATALVLMGATLTLLLVVIGVLLTVGSGSIKGTVHDQLSAAKITFPPKNAPGMTPALNEYAGKPVENGDQAEKYANVYVANLMTAAGGGKTYAQLFPVAQAQPTNPQLAAQTEALFRGETVRNLLVDAYGFEGIAKLLMWCAVICYIGAVIFAVLTALALMSRPKDAAVA